MDGTLGKKCYDQSPCGLACTFGKDLGMTIEHCRDLIKGDRLKGFSWFVGIIAHKRVSAVRSWSRLT